jgi:hypothetical protein
MIKFIRSEVILPVLIVEFELGTFLLHKRPFSRIEFGDGLDAVRTIIVRALVDGHFLLMFPSKESKTAIRAEELRLFTGSESLLHLEQKRTDLAENLRAFLPVVEIEIDAWRPAAEADDVNRNQ